jgi:hypothetical protein
VLTSGVLLPITTSRIERGGCGAIFQTYCGRPKDVKTPMQTESLRVTGRKSWMLQLLWPAQIAHGKPVTQLPYSVRFSEIHLPGERELV